MAAVPGEYHGSNKGPRAGGRPLCVNCVQARPNALHAPPRAPQDFWSQIYTSYALVPSFGMPVYYESRISSTILASLITCVPIIAEQKLMDTYTFLKWVTG